MGTRADFYLGRGRHARWLGSIGFDGYPDDRHVAPLLEETTEAGYLAAVAGLLSRREDATLPEQGWPWPWTDSVLTDFAYCFDNGEVNVFCFGHPFDIVENEDVPGCDKEEFPDMSKQQNVTFGVRSGLTIIRGDS